MLLKENAYYLSDGVYEQKISENYLKLKNN